MPRLLIVSPHFPPVNAPDMQRVRMSLPHFVAAGWEVCVLTVADPDPQAPLEPELEQTVPPEVRVVRAHCLPRRTTRRLGVGNLGLRALPFLYREGRRLLREQRFDVIYFSTTQFVVIPLGRLWRGEFGVPYVVDLQDPWRSDYYSRPGSPRPPGGWKHRFARLSAALLEGWTLRRASHVIAVSPSYLAALASRYAWWNAKHASVLSFGTPDGDLALVRARPRAALLPPGSKRRIVYAGRLGEDMRPALQWLFAAVAELERRGMPCELFFYGSSYAGEGAAPLARDLARQHGIGHLVHEHPARIGYLDSLQLLLEGDVVLVLGSDDTDYSPSKVYPALAAGRPVLCLAPAGSVLHRLIEELGGAALVTFDRRSAPSAAQREEVASLLARCFAGERPGPPLQRALIEQRFTAEAVAREQLALFERYSRG